MTPPLKSPEDDPGSSNLPPVNPAEEKREKPLGWIPTEGVSPKLKIFVIGLTFVTLAAFGIFIALFIKKMFVLPAGKKSWDTEWVTIADELRQKGLRPQAIEHYRKYLDTGDADRKTRGRIAVNIAQLYVEMGQCDDAFAWFLHAKTAHPETPGVGESETLIQQCRRRSPSSP